MLENNSAVRKPPLYDVLIGESDTINFSMCSDLLTGSLLRTLASCKSGARILELGTGTGLALSWMLDGADENSTIISIDNDPGLINLAGKYFNEDPRVKLICEDGNDWIKSYDGQPFDLIFADAWPGKFELLEETLQLLVQGGIYVIDDLIPRSTWPDGHLEKVALLIDKLETTETLNLTKMNWSTGLIIATRQGHFE